MRRLRSTGAAAVSGSRTAPPPAHLRAALARASLVTRTPLLLAEGACAQAAAFAAKHLQAAPGQRCLVVTPPTSARAAPLLHYLRRGGFFPLTVELPDGAPSAAHVAAALGAARRTGVSFVVGVGSSSTLSVARAVAALLPNGGAVLDYAEALGGKRALGAPSLPLLSVPTCPSGLELTREALLLVEGHALAALRAHPDSLQAALVDPALAASLRGEAALTTGWSALAHALEAYARPDSGRQGRELAWVALELAARALLPSLAAPPPKGSAAAAAAASAASSQPSPATCLAASSALVSAALAEGPLGPCRGLALSIAARYAIPYATALLAVTPRVFGEPAARTLGAYEEIAREMADSVAEQARAPQQEGAAGEEPWSWDGGARGGSRRAARGGLPAPAPLFGTGGKRPAGGGGGGGGAAGAAGAAAGPRSAEAEAAAREAAREEAEEDAELMRLARAASEDMMGAGPAAPAAPPRPLPLHYSAAQEVPLSEGDEDSDLIRAARRYAHVGALLREVQAAPSDGGDGALAPWAPLEAVEASVRLDAGGRALGLGLEGALRALSAAGARAAQLKSGAPTLEDYGLTDADHAAVAEMAEVDANTLTSFMPLKRADIVEMLQES